MRWRPHIHVRIMEDEILNVNKLARNPQAGGRIEEMAPFDIPLPHGTAPHGLVEACEVILRCRFHFPISIAVKSCAV